MNDFARKKPGVAFWATVVMVCLLLVYPLTIAPALWLCQRAGQPDWMVGFISRFYDPLWAAALRSDESTDWLFRYSICFLSGEEFRIASPSMFGRYQNHR
jgi:hypothetical protein